MQKTEIINMPKAIFICKQLGLNVSVLTEEESLVLMKTLENSVPVRRVQSVSELNGDINPSVYFDNRPCYTDDVR